MLQVHDEVIDDWWTRLVLQRKDSIEPLGMADTVNIVQAIGHHTVKSMYNVCAVWDNLTDVLFIESNVKGEDPSEATQKAIEPIYYGLTDIKSRYGNFRIANMQLISVEHHLLAEQDGLITSERFDVTEDARDAAELAHEKMVQAMYDKRRIDKDNAVFLAMTADF